MKGPGEIVEGRMEAASQLQVIESLRNQDLLPLSADERGPAPAMRWQGLHPRRRGVSRGEVTVVLRELATLLQAGLAIDKALTVMTSFSTKGRAKDVLADILAKVRDGMPLSQAMAAQDDTFDRFCIGMVRAGEAGGTLDSVLDRTVGHMEHAQKAKQKLRSAMIYPAVLLVSALISILVIMTVVIPSFADIFNQANIELPLITKIVVAVGDIAARFWWLPIGLSLVGLLVVMRLRRDPEQRVAFDRWLLRVPGLGPLLLKGEVARICYTLGMLLRNQVPLLAALGIARETLTNRALARSFERVAGDVKEGSALTQPLAAEGLFPDQATHLLRIGEESARLEEMLFHLAEMYDDEVDRATQRFMSLLLPGLTIVMALLIAGIMVSILVPMLGVQQLAL